VRHEPHEVLEHRACLDQQVEGENQDCDQAEHTADQPTEHETIDRRRKDRTKLVLPAILLNIIAK
jgi:hypothetical protein